MELDPNDFLAAKTNPDALWDYELNDYANPEYRAAKEPRELEKENQ